MTYRKTRAMGWCLLAMLAVAAEAAEKEPAAVEIDFARAAYTPVTDAALTGWKAQGWQVQANELPNGWVPSGTDGFVTVVTEPKEGRLLRFKGQLRGSSIPLPVSGWVVVQTTLRDGSVTVSGPVYSRADGSFLGWFQLPDYDAGPQWTTLTCVHHLKQPQAGSGVLHLSATKGPVDVRGVKILSATGALDAYRQAYPLIRKPMVNLVKNGGFEEVKLLLPEELRKWREELRWDLGEGARVMLPSGFGPHICFKDKRLRVIDDPGQSHSGSRCVEFSLMAGGGFMAKPDKVYLFSLWARGEGKLTVFANLYGGPDGGYLGNLPVTGSAGFELTEQWENLQVTVPLAKEGYAELGINPVFTPAGVAVVDDFAVFELDTGETLLAKIAQVQKSLRETLTDQVQLGPRQREMLKFLDDEAVKLRGQCSAADTDDNLEALAHCVEALNYVTAGLKSEMEFGNAPE